MRRGRDGLWWHRRMRGAGGRPILDIDAVVVSEGESVRCAGGRLVADEHGVQVVVTPPVDEEPAMDPLEVTIELPDLDVEVTEFGDDGQVGPFVSLHLEDHDLLVRVADPEAAVAAIRSVCRRTARADPATCPGDDRSSSDRSSSDRSSSDRSSSDQSSSTARSRP